MRALVWIGAAVFACGLFIGAQWVFFLEQINQEERAAYIVFQGYCKHNPEALCINREVTK